MASTKGLSAEEVRECAVKLQDDFLRAHSGNPDMVQRDIQKVRTTISYVEKFVRHNRGSHNKAFQHMVESLTWRKSFGINDVKFDDIDDVLWQSGMAFNHGYDATGQNVVILNIAKHRKDSKKAPMLRKWIAFCFEMQQRVYPNNKMCMVFDMDGAGLSNMDMDLVRFVINCFKIYFPDLLEWLLVYNMPWILQAAWKIVQSWLSDGGAAKVKFVTMDNIQEYIPAHNLLTKYGGSDTWEFVYEVERKNMLGLLEQAESQIGARSDDLAKGSPHDEAVSEVSEGVGWSQDESVKQVRFSSNVPPTRQSRYGSDDEESFGNNVSGSDQSLLKKGSATALGFRRRQVTRLMSLQEQGSHDKEPEVEATGRETRSLNGSILSTAELDSSTVAVGDVILSPPNELVFAGQKDSDVICTLTLKNMSVNSAAYKIKTTAPLRYKVRPNLALIDSKAIAKVQVMLMQGSEIKSSLDKFLVQTHTFPDPETVPKLADLPMYWKALPPASVKEHRMRCRWLTEIPSRSVIPSQRNSTSRDNVGGSRSPSSKTAAAAAGGKAMPSWTEETLEQKIQKLVTAHDQLNHSVANLQRLNYGIVVILVILLLSIIFF